LNADPSLERRHPSPAFLNWGQSIFLCCTVWFDQSNFEDEKLMLKPISRHLTRQTDYDRDTLAESRIWRGFGIIAKNPFTVHPLSKGQTYLEHLLTASTIGLRLLISAFAFILHSIFPFVPIPQPLNLEALALFLLQENQFIETRLP
jgi:Family of unknown function (DUF6356)